LPGKLRSRLIWHPDQMLSAANVSFSALSGVAGLPKTTEEKPDLNFPVAPRERAIAFLHIGSEIEHALMVQYLYAAYSLNEDQPDEKQRALVRRWKAAVLEIAREEMGHFASVQTS